MKQRPITTGLLLAALFTSPHVVIAQQTRSFHELNVDGLPNAAGLSIIGIRKGDQHYEIDVQGSAVSAQPHGRGGSRLTGASLIGLVIDLRDESGARQALRVAGIHTTVFLAGTPDPVATYELTYTTNTGVAKPLCAATNNEAILFSGDRYDAVSKTVTARRGHARLDQCGLRQHRARQAVSASSYPGQSARADDSGRASGDVEDVDRRRLRRR